MNIRKWLLLMTLLTVIFLLSLSAVRGAQSAFAPITVENATQVKELAQLKGHTGPVFSLAFSPDSQSLVSGGSGLDYTAVLWDIGEESQRATLSGHTAQIAAVGFNADGSQVLTASYDASIRTWDSRTGAALETIDKDEADEGFYIESLNTFFSVDGSKLVYSGGLSVYVVELATHQQVDMTSNLGLIQTVVSVAISPDGKTVAWMDDTATVHLMEVESLAETATLIPTETTEYGGTMTFSRDSKMLAVSNYDTSNIQIWNLDTKEAGALLTGHTPNDDGTLTVNSLAFNLDGTLLASASYDNTIRIWDVSAGNELVSLDASQAAVVLFSPDGKILASSDVEGVVHLWGITGN